MAANRQARALNIISHIPVVVWALDRGRRYTLSEGAGLESLGLQSKQIVGQRHGDLFGPEGTAGSLIERAFNGETFYVEAEIRDRYYSTYYTPIFDDQRDVMGILAVSTDTTVQARYRNRLEESEEQFKVLFDAAALGIATIGLDGIYRQANPAYERLTGYTEAEFLKLHWKNIIAPQDRASSEAAVVKFLGASRERRSQRLVLEKSYLKKTASTSGRTWPSPLCKTVADYTPDPVLISIASDFGRGFGRLSFAYFRHPQA